MGKNVHDYQEPRALAKMLLTDLSAAFHKCQSASLHGGWCGRCVCVREREREKERERKRERERERRISVAHLPRLDIAERDADVLVLLQPQVRRHTEEPLL